LAIRISDGARRDLIEIWSYIAKDSEDAADGVLDRLQEYFFLLARSPMMGRRRDDLRSGYRSVIAQSYVVLYRVVDKDVEIVRVIHGKRDLDAVLDERTLLVGSAEFDRDEVVDTAGGAFVFGNDELEGAVFVDWFAVDGVGDEDVSGMEGGVGFGEREDCFVAVAASGDDVVGEAFAAKLVSGGCSVFRQEIGEWHSSVGFVGLGVDIVEGDGFLGESLEVG
jgi:toxin ParE1/3/4